MFDFLRRLHWGDTPLFRFNFRRQARRESVAAAAVAAAHSTGATRKLGEPQPAPFQDYVELYSEQATVYRCANIIANDLARVPLSFYKGERDGDREQLDAAHPLVQLFKTVSPYHTPYTLKLNAGLALELTGNSYWELFPPRTKSSTAPVEELWPMAPQRMYIVPGEKHVMGYLHFVNQKPQAFGPDDVFHIKYPDPNNDFYGISPLRAASRALLGNELIDKHATAFLKNEARPSAVVMLEEGLTAAQMQALRAQWEDLYVGSGNAGKTIFIPKARGYQPITISPKEMELLSAKKLNREDIIIAHGLMPIFFGVLERATFENANIQLRIYWENTILPKLRLIEEQITERLFPILGMDLDGVFAEFDISEISIFRELELREAVAKAPLVADGTLSRNEVRAGMGYDPTPFGNAWWGDVNQIPLGSFSEDEPLPEPPAPPPTASEDDADLDEGFEPEVETESEPDVEAASTEDEEESDASDLVEPAPGEKGVVDDVVSAMKIEPDSSTAKDFKKLYKQIARAAGTRAATQQNLNTLFNVNDPEVLKFIETRAQEFFDFTLATTAKQMRTSFAEEETKGLLDVLTDSINKIFDKRIKTDAKTGAKTEVHGTENYGTLKAYKQAGLAKHWWLSARDMEVRESHRNVERISRKKPVLIDTPFSNGLLYPGDTSKGAGESINCRCTLMAVIPGGGRRQPNDFSDAHERFLVNVWRAADASFTRHEKQFQLLVVDMFEEQRRRAITALRVALGETSG